MVKGLDQFKKHFALFPKNYVLIGGTACQLAMEKMGLHFRATKDLDIVLCVEALDRKFAEAFWGICQNWKISTPSEKYWKEPILSVSFSQ